MNFIEKAQLENIQTVAQMIGDKFFYISKERNLEFIQMNEDFRKTFVCSDVIGVRSFKNYLNITTRKDILGDENTLLVYNVDTSESITPVADINSFFSVNKNEYEIIYCKKDIHGYYGIYNYNVCQYVDDYIMQGKLLVFPTYVTPLVITEAETTVFVDQIRAYNLEKCNIEWQYDVREVGRYYNTTVKTWENGKVHCMTTAANKIFFLAPVKLICLDALTGSVLWIKEFDEYRFKKLIYTQMTNELLLFDLQEFSFIDPDTGHVSRKSHSFYKSFQEKGLAAPHCTSPVVTEKYIYITFCFEKKIFIIDKYNFSIEHVIDMNTSQDIIAESDAPIIYEDMILQRSMDNILHVYKET